MEAQKDCLVRAISKDGFVNAVAVYTRGLTERARQIHHTSPVATAALGRALAACSMMGNALKDNGASVTMQIKGDGPLGTILTVSDSEGNVRGYVQNPAVDLALREDGKLDVGGALGRSGTVTVVRDLGLREPYVGQCPLQSSEVGEDVAYYCALSEQQPTLCSLGVLVADRVVASGGLLVQPLPGCDEAVLSALELRAPIYADISHHLQAERIDALFPQFFRGLDPQVLDDESLVYACDCSRERMERVLLSMGRAELEDILRTQGSAEVTCSFCRTAHRFGREELEALLLQA